MEYIGNMGAFARNYSINVPYFHESESGAEAVVSTRDHSFSRGERVYLKLFVKVQFSESTSGSWRHVLFYIGYLYLVKWREFIV